ncbi:hypothetical protein E4U17_007467 [Claviceps sp. LM77 group G4]|nr:hypothetical protein E4U17_007467 [Claviceps sp. LM77 group G4]KAG6078721.1 hypothetical protein E4U16_001487 [Claviceps sp. LM84 group G4]
MAKILSILIATLAVVSPVAQAAPCTPGLHYCGHTLQQYGYPGAQSLGYNTLYQCQSDGSVGELVECSFPYLCRDGGAGRRDYCEDISF